MEGYIALDEEHQQRNIVAWRPTLVEILDGFVSFSDSDVNSSIYNALNSQFSKQIENMYPVCVEIIGRQSPDEVRSSLKRFFARVGDVLLKGKSARA